MHHTTSSSCGCGDHCNHFKKHSCNHLSIQQWVRSAIHVSQQVASPIVSYLRNFRHRLARYSWQQRTIATKVNPKHVRVSGIAATLAALLDFLQLLSLARTLFPLHADASKMLNMFQKWEDASQCVCKFAFFQHGCFVYFRHWLIFLVFLSMCVRHTIE